MANKAVLHYTLRESCEDRQTGSFKVASFTQAVCTASEFEENHKHEYFEIIWLKNGKGIHQIDLLPHPYEGPVLFVLSPGQIHKIEQQVLSEGYILKFLPSVFKYEKDFYDFVLDTCILDGVQSCPVVKIPPHLNPFLEDLFLRLVEEYTQLSWEAETIVSSYLKILITHINRIKRHNLTEEFLVKNPQYGLFREFKLAIEKYYRQEHSVQGYAELLNTQARTLNAVARKYNNRSAGEMIQDRILLEAQRNLYHGSQSIKEICFDLGFEDPAYFTRFFKKHTGISPQQFKEKAMLQSVSSIA